MASTTARIAIVIDAVERGVASAAARARAAIAGLRAEVDRQDKAFGKVNKAVTAFATSLATIPGLIALFGGPVLAVTTAALAPFVTSLLLIPAAVAGLGAVFATVKIGLSGFGDAVKKGGKDLAALSPNARAAAQALRDLAPEFKKVKDSVQDALFKGLAENFKLLGSTYLPILKTGLAGIAQPLNGLAVSFVRVLKSGQSVKDVNTVLAGTKTALTGIEPALGNIAVGFLRLAAQGIKNFAGLGKGITDLTIKFRDWANALVISGRFDAAIERMKASFRTLGDIASNVGSIISSVFGGLSSGAGGSPLDSLQRLTAALAEFLKTAEAQDALKALGDAFRAISDAVRGVLLEALKQLAPIITDLAPVVASIAQSFGTLLVNALREVGPLIEGFAKVLRDNKEIVTIVADALLLLYGRFLLFKGITAATTAIRGVVTALGGLRGLGLLGLAVGIGAVAIELDKLNVAAAPNGDTEKSGGLADTLHNIVEAGKQIASGDISGIVAKIKDEVAQTNQTWADGQAPIQQWVDKVKTSFSNDLIAPMEAFGTKVNEIIDKIVQSFSNDFLTPLTDFGTTVNTMISNVIAGMEQFGATVNLKISEVIGFIAGLPAQAGAALSTFAQVLVTSATQGWNGFLSVCTTVGGAVVSFIAGIPGAVGGALSSFIGVLVGVATQGWNGFLSTTTAVVGTVIGFVTGIPGRVSAALGPIIAGVVGVATTAWNNFLGAVRSGTDAVLGFVRGIPGSIVSAIGNLGSILVGAGRALIDGLLAGIRAGVSAVLDFARGIAAQIAAVKGPLSYDKVVLKPAGLALMQGLLNGLKQGNAQVQAYVGTIADGIADAAGTGGLIASARLATAGATGANGPGITTTSAPLPVTIPIHIGDEVVRVVRTEIDTSNRDVRRTVRAGAGVTAG